MHEGVIMHSCLGEVKSTLYSRFCNRKPCIRHTAYTSRRPTCRAAGGQSGSSTALARATSVQLRSLDWLPICSHYSIKALGKALRKKETLGQSGGVVVALIWDRDGESDGSPAGRRSWAWGVGLICRRLPRASTEQGHARWNARPGTELAYRRWGQLIKLLVGFSIVEC